MAIRIIGGITIPSEEEVNNSIVFKTYGTQCEATDFVSCFAEKKVGKDQYIEWPLKDKHDHYVENYNPYYGEEHTLGAVRTVDSDGSFGYMIAGHVMGTGLRPVIHFKEMSDIAPYIVRVKNGIPEAEICEISQFVVNNRTRRALDKANSNGTLKSYWTAFGDVYIYNGEKYIRKRIEPRRGDKKFISGHRVIRKCVNVWIKISPIVWYVDEKLGLLISKYAIEPVADYDNKHYYGGYNGDFEKTDLFNYLNAKFLYKISYFLDKKVFKEIKSEPIMEEVPDTIPEMIGMIKEILKYFPNDNKTMDKVNVIIDENNEEIKEIADNYRKNEINLNLKTPEMIQRETLDKLTKLYEELKKNYEKIKVYNDMLEVIDDSKKVLDNVESKTDDTDLYKIFSDIGTFILPVMDEPQKGEIKNLLLDVLNKYENEIKKYKETVSETNKLKYNSIEELEMSIRVSIYAILLRLGYYVERLDLLSKINNETKNKMDKNFKKGKYSQIKMYLRNIDEVSTNIKWKINKNPEGYDSYKEQLDGILNFHVDFEMTDEEIHQILFKVCKDLSTLEEKLNDELQTNGYLIDKKIL